MTCNTCNKKVSSFQNYGSDEKPSCRKCHEDNFRRMLNERRAKMVQRVS
jgi:DNA-directed RNA polymerase subunit RPC12/RpoP